MLENMMLETLANCTVVSPLAMLRNWSIAKFLSCERETIAAPMGAVLVNNEVDDSSMYKGLGLNSIGRELYDACPSSARKEECHSGCSKEIVSVSYAGHIYHTQ